MKTYWFTVIGGKVHAYQEHVRNLVASGHQHGIDVNVASLPGGDIEAAFMHKARTILSAPPDCDRICFVDADAVIQDPSGHEDLHGSFLESRKQSVRKLAHKEKWEDQEIAEIRFSRIAGLLRDNGLSDFADQTHPYAGAEWNSGVIMGDRGFMQELAETWLWWYEALGKANDGVFRGDQVSYRIAYYLVGMKKYGFETIPETWNWMIKRKGFNEEANILHRAGHPNGKLCEAWRVYVAEMLGNEDA